MSFDLPNICCFCFLSICSVGIYWKCTWREFIFTVTNSNVLALRSFLVAFVYFFVFRVKMLLRSRRDLCLVPSLPKGLVGSAPAATPSISLGGLPTAHSALRGGLQASSVSHLQPVLTQQENKISWKRALHLLTTGSVPLPVAPFPSGHSVTDQRAGPP